MPDPKEPQHVAEAMTEINTDHVVVTSVTRDDLPDGGAAQWAETIRRIRQAEPNIVIEVLVPDFCGTETSVRTVARAGPDIFGHNLETVRSLYPTLRCGADYDRSLAVLRWAAEEGCTTKTAFMLGAGESQEEVTGLLEDARCAGCHILYIGQYLQPTKQQIPVHRYVPPREFEAYRQVARQMGFAVVEAGPFVRSSCRSEAQRTFLLKQRSGRFSGYCSPGKRSCPTP